MTHSTLQEDSLYKSPTYIVLDTREMVRKLMRLRSSHVADDKEEEEFTNILDEVLQIISTQRDVELSLQYESISIVQQALACVELDQIVEFTRFMVQFGMDLVGQLILAGAYTNGRLNYSYHGRAGHDIVLVQTFFDPDPHAEPSFS